MGISCTRAASEKELPIRSPIEWNLASEFVNLLLNDTNAVLAEASAVNKFPSLKFLSLVGLDLTSLKGIPLLPSLQFLDLSKNQLSGGLELLKNCPVLKYLNLEENQVEDIDSLNPLKDLKNLNSLKLAKCRISIPEDYRKSVFDALPSVQFLDGYDINGNPEQQVCFDGYTGKYYPNGTLTPPHARHSCERGCIDGYKIIPDDNFCAQYNSRETSRDSSKTTYLIQTYFNCGHPNVAITAYYSKITEDFKYLPDRGTAEVQHYLQ